MVLYTSNDTFSAMDDEPVHIPDCFTDYWRRRTYNAEKAGWYIEYEMRTCSECLKETDLMDFIDGFNKVKYIKENGFAIPGSLL
jgi:hypothetical protein